MITAPPATEYNTRPKDLLKIYRGVVDREGYHPTGTIDSQDMQSDRSTCLGVYLEKQAFPCLTASQRAHLHNDFCSELTSVYARQLEVTQQQALQVFKWCMCMMLASSRHYQATRL